MTSVGAALAGLLVLLLTVFPVARLELGRVPVYISDLLISLALLALLWRGGFEYGRFGLVVLLYLVAWLPAWVLQMTTLNIFLEPTYGLIRNVLAVCCFFVGFAAARQHQLSGLGVPLVVGTLVTSLIAIAQELPITRKPVHDALVAVAPAFVPDAYEHYWDRAFALFSAATTLSGFLAVVIPLYLVGSRSIRAPGQIIALGVAVLAGVAAVATVSRQWLPALAVGLLVLIVLRRKRVSRILTWGTLTVALTAVLFATGGLNASYLVARFARLAQGSQEPNIAIRLERQVTFLEEVGAGLAPMVRSGPATPAPAATPRPASSPAVGGGPVGTLLPTAAPSPSSSKPVSVTYDGVQRAELWHALLGIGFANQDLIERGKVDAATAAYLLSGYNDNVFLLEARNHGISAALLYLALLLVALGRGFAASRWLGPSQALIAGLTASLATAFVLHFFDNYFSESVFMKSGLWLLIGALVGLTASRPERSEPASAAAATSPT